MRTLFMKHAVALHARNTKIVWSSRLVRLSASPSTSSSSCSSSKEFNNISPLKSLTETRANFSTAVNTPGYHHCCLIKGCGVLSSTILSMTMLNNGKLLAPVRPILNRNIWTQSWNPLNANKQSKKLLPFEVDTNIAEDTLLFKYQNDRFIMMMSLFGIAQLIFWMYLANFSYSSLRDATVEEENKIMGVESTDEDTDALPWWKKINLGENKYRNGITILCFTVGYLVTMVSVIYPIRTVRQLQLLKGGEMVKIVTYGPFATSRTFTSPVKSISCLQDRTGKETQISMKIKGRYMFYLLDKNGQFSNTKLFDQTVGLIRKLK